MTVSASPGGSIIYLEDVTVDYDGFKALNGLNFYMDYKELRVVIVAPRARESRTSHRHN